MRVQLIYQLDLANMTQVQQKVITMTSHYCLTRKIF